MRVKIVKKKVISILLGITMILAFAIPSYASDDLESSTGVNDNEQSFDLSLDVANTTERDVIDEDQGNNLIRGNSQEIVISEQNVIQSGNYGSTINWTLDGFGNLTISGEGSMINVEPSSTEGWRQLKSDIKTITITKGVEHIGNYAFSDCPYLRLVTIQEGLTSIGMASFYNCTSLTKIKIPDSLKTIGLNAFEGCSVLG